jgi:hypothetical protein
MANNRAAKTSNSIADFLVEVDRRRQAFLRALCAQEQPRGTANEEYLDPEERQRAGRRDLLAAIPQDLKVIAGLSPLIAKISSAAISNGTIDTVRPIVEEVRRRLGTMVRIALHAVPDPVVDDRWTVAWDALNESMGELRTWQFVPNDEKTDTGKKLKKYRRPMTVAASDCVRRFKHQDRRRLNLPMKTVVEDYVAEVRKGSSISIMRTLNDNPDSWKNDKKTTSD